VNAGHHKADDLIALSEGIIQAGSKSFAAAARLFDRPTRASAYLLYAWCRHCDDVIDGQELGFATPATATSDPVAALARLREMTAATLDGRPMTDPIFAAFQRVAAKHKIPEKYPFALLDGFEMDVTGRTYVTIDDTLTYCYHVAGVVGVMMALVMGAEGEDTLDRASDLGIAFQLTNIARDVVDDAKVGRIYLPQQWLDAAGIASSEVHEPRHRVRLHGVVTRLLDLADQYYASSSVGLARLPPRSRWAVATARRVYAKIGDEVRRRGPNAWDTRVSTSKAQKLIAVAGGGASAATAPFGTSRVTRDGLWTRPR